MILPTLGNLGGRQDHFSPDCPLFKKTLYLKNPLFKNVGTLENLGPAGQIISQESGAALYWGCPLLWLPSIGLPSI